MNRQSSPCIFSVSPGWSHANSFDEIGNRKTATLNGRVSTYTPNPLNQIDSRTIPRAFDVIGKANSTATVTVDGNAATRLDEYFYKELTAGTGAVHVLYTVAATDANGTTSRDGGKFLPATPETFIHDFDGNLTSDGRFAYTWDAENRLITMETHSTIPLPARRKLVFAYDFMGRRIKKDVWHGTSNGGWQLHHKFDFIHELGGWNILAERSGGSKDSFLRTFTWGTDLSGTLNGAGGVGGLLLTKLHPSGKTFANAMDLNGNVTLLVNTATGQSAATYDYGPFGEPLRQSGEYASLNPFRFSTKYTDDETGLVEYGLRPYIPSTGTWPSRDPIGEKGGVNLYGFVGNDGINKWDILGLELPESLKCCKIKKIVVNFTSVIEAPKNKISNDGVYNHKTGRLFLGELSAECADGNSKRWDAQSGGMRMKGSTVDGPSTENPDGDDSPAPAGDFTVETSPSGGTKGYLINTAGTGRGNIKVHYASYAGSHGCATSRDPKEWQIYVELMALNRHTFNKKSVSIRVQYVGVNPIGSRGGGKSDPPLIPVPLVVPLF